MFMSFIRGVELHSDTNAYFFMQPEICDPRGNILNISYPRNGDKINL